MEEVLFEGVLSEEVLSEAVLSGGGFVLHSSAPYTFPHTYFKMVQPYKIHLFTDNTLFTLYFIKLYYYYYYYELYNIIMMCHTQLELLIKMVCCTH